MWRKLKDKIILLLADKETVYAGPGTYHWLNHEEKVILRNTQRVVGFGVPGTTRVFSIINDRNHNWTHILGRINTTTIEQLEDDLEREAKMKEAHLQANAYLDWLESR